MRRCVVILLLMLLPFQFAWSAAAGYCAHETEVNVKHFGHHVHVHKAGKAVDSNKHVGGLSAPDDDCSACHLSAPTLPPAMPVVALPGPQLVPPVVTVTLPPSAIPDTPERPNWSLAA